MKTVKFFYAHTTQDLQVPDDTPVLTSKVDQLTSERTGIEIVREAMALAADICVFTNSHLTLETIEK